MSETMEAGAAGQTTSTAVAVRAPRQFMTVESPVGIMDTARFEHLGRVARVLAEAKMLPMSLTHYEAGKKDGKPIMEEYPLPTLIARAYLITSQAELWNADPIAIAQCTSLVHGKLCYEGKLVHALIEAKSGISLRYAFGRYDVQKRDIIEGEMPAVDDQALGVRVYDRDCPEDFIAGSVAMWHTGDRGPWGKALNWVRQLRYRGAREWARAYKPHLILGILTEDEVEDFQELQQARAAALIESRTTKRELKGKLKGGEGEGFSQTHIDAETAPKVDEIPEAVVEEIKPVGGEQAQAETVEVEVVDAEVEEIDTGEAETAVQPAAEASGSSDSATAASDASPVQPDYGQPPQSAPSSAGSAAPSTPPSAAKEKKPRASSKAKTPEPAPEPDAAEHPIEAFIDGLEGLTGWREDIKPAVSTLKRSDIWKTTPPDKQTAVAVAVCERIWEIDPDFKAWSDVSFFALWCAYMIDTAARPIGGSTVAMALDKLRGTDGYKALADTQKQAIEAVANMAIATCGTPGV